MVVERWYSFLTLGSNSKRRKELSVLSTDGVFAVLVLIFLVFLLILPKVVFKEGSVPPWVTGLTIVVLAREMQPLVSRLRCPNVSLLESVAMLTLSSRFSTDIEGTIFLVSSVTSGFSFPVLELFLFNDCCEINKNV